jgi:DNA-binding NtrC family response regulator
VAEENGVQAPEIPPDTMARMMAYEWPGNVRELENFIERGVIMHAGARSLPFDPPAGGPPPGLSGIGLMSRARDERWDLDRLEREYILLTLEDTQWHQGNTAEILGINRRTLYRKLKRYRAKGLLPETLARQ